MKTKFLARIREKFAINDMADNPNPESIDLREEYANAFRTESYTEFWTHVLALNKGNFSIHRSVGSTSVARLPSYRLFAEQLLDPDQSTVERILESNRTRPEISSLLHDYFSCTSDASNLCGLLLKDIDHTRKRYKLLKGFFGPSKKGPCLNPNPNPNPPTVLTRVTLFSKSNPFRPSGPSLNRFQIIQASCSDLLKRVELRRDKTKSKIRQRNKLKCGSTIFLVALTASLTVVIATHGFALLVAAPGLVAAASFELVSTEKMARWTAQLDAAAKGTYILIRDLDTISRLVARLNNELEHMEASMQLWLQLQTANGEVSCQVNKNDQNFIQQIDELEEHLYLCLMTINRARNLVIKEILNFGIDKGNRSSSLNPLGR